MEQTLAGQKNDSDEGGGGKGGIGKAKSGGGKKEEKPKGGDTKAALAALAAAAGPPPPQIFCDGILTRDQLIPVLNLEWGRAIQIGGNLLRDVARNRIALKNDLEHEMELLREEEEKGI